MIAYIGPVVTVAVTLAGIAPDIRKMSMDLYAWLTQDTAAEIMEPCVQNEAPNGVASYFKAVITEVRKERGAGTGKFCGCGRCHKTEGATIARRMQDMNGKSFTAYEMNRNSSIICGQRATEGQLIMSRGCSSGNQA